MYDKNHCNYTWLLTVNRFSYQLKHNQNSHMWHKHLPRACVSENAPPIGWKTDLIINKTNTGTEKRQYLQSPDVAAKCFYLSAFQTCDVWASPPFMPAHVLYTVLYTIIIIASSNRKHIFQQCMQRFFSFLWVCVCVCMSMLKFCSEHLSKAPQDSKGHRVCSHAIFISP